jgi:hypothetical protein
MTAAAPPQGPHPAREPRPAASPRSATATALAWLPLRGGLEDLVAALQERARVLGLELRQSAQAAGRMLALAVLATLLALTGWLVFVAGLMGVAIELGTPWPIALLVGALLNVAAAWFAYRQARRGLARISIAQTLEGLGLPADAAGDKTGPAGAPPADAASSRAAGQIAAAGDRATRLWHRGLLGGALGLVLLLAQRRSRRRAAPAGPAPAAIDRWIAWIPGLTALLRPLFGARATTLLTVLAGARAAMNHESPANPSERKAQP